jgi:hypothetical protein
MDSDMYTRACWQGACNRIRQMLDERIRQLQKLSEKAAASTTPHPTHARLLRLLESETAALASVPVSVSLPPQTRAHIAALHETGTSPGHVRTIQSLPEHIKATTQAWLQAIVEHVQNKWEQTAHE